MKRTGILILLLLIAIGISAIAETPATQIYACGDYTYIVLPGGDAQIVSWDGAEAALTVPETLDGHAVVSVSECAFADCAGLERIALPGTVREIGDNAFVNCRRLQEVELSEGLERLGRAAFEGCEGLTRIALPDTLRSLGENPFLRCANLYDIRVSAEHAYLKTVDGVLFTRDGTELICFPMGNAAEYYRVPDGVETIGAMAFDRDLYIERIELPSSLTCIGDGAFDGCEALRAMNMPAGVRSIGADAIRCSNLTITFEDGDGVALLAGAVEIRGNDA